MTYKEYLQTLASFINGLNFTDTQVEFILAEQGLDGDDTINTEDDRIEVQTAIYYQIPLIIAGLHNVQEGGYSISWNVDALKLWYCMMAKKLGLEDEITGTVPTIRDRSNFW